jgi:hypothetical protein
MKNKNSFQNPARGDIFFLYLIKYVSKLSLVCLFALIVGCVWNTETIGKAPNKMQVLFAYKGQFQTVCLTGDFNDWSPNTHCLERNGDIWKIKVFLSPGRYKYAFILDGIHWTPDPNAFLLENDGFGMKNSVLIVE